MTVNAVKTLSIMFSLVFFCVSTHEVWAGNINVPSGKWEGTYMYKSNTGRKSVNFTVQLNSSGDSFNGKMVEPRTFGESTSDFLYADIIGRVNGDGAFMFMKKYDGTAGAAHTVFYAGQINISNMHVNGAWTIDKATGSFEMRFSGN